MILFQMVKLQQLLKQYVKLRKFNNVSVAIQLTSRYATVNKGILSFYVSGAHSTDISFMSTGSCTGVYVDKVIDVSIPSGATIKFQFDSGEVAVNLDYIELGSGDGGTQLPPLQCKKIVVYWAAWEWYNGNYPSSIDATKVTHINYAFADIGNDLKVKMGYPVVDPSSYQQLRDLKNQNPDLKLLISVGGWTWSGKFSDVALTETSRTNFANSCVSFILEHGFDGVDIDWEYPVGGGAAGNTTRPEDKQNFTLLMTKLREKLDAQRQIDGKQYLLTVALAASESKCDTSYELNLLHQYVDFINIITYDYHGWWDQYTDFNSLLYTPIEYSPQDKFSINQTIQYYLSKGVPANKIVVGVPFYGYKYNGVTNANKGWLQTFTPISDQAESSIPYKKLVTDYIGQQGYTRYWHSTAKVPWLFNGSTFISYDDTISLNDKMDYILSNGLAGTMIWELSQDDSSKTLLNTVYNKMSD